MPTLPFGYTKEEARQPAPMPPMPYIYEPIKPPKWEYHVLMLDPREEVPLDEERLRALGSEGWLLVSVLPYQPGASVSRIIYYFVRAA